MRDHGSDGHEEKHQQGVGRFGVAEETVHGREAEQVTM